jgi:pimeloyl-ACP methyl ester carboxylesterase
LILNATLTTTEEDWTAAPVVLMTHGTLAHGGMEIMHGLQNMLKERDISSLAITLSLGLDNRHGMYDCALPHTHRHQDAVAEIGVWLEWLKTQGATRIALLGHSRGGNQAARFALADPDSGITTLALLAPQTWSAEEATASYRKRYGKELAAELDKARAQLAQGQGDALLADMDFIYCPNSRVSAHAFLSYYQADPDMDTPRLLPRIKAPVLVFVGSNDDTVAGLEEKVAAIADGEKIRLMTIDGADHFFRDLYSEEVADALADLLHAQ